MRIDHIRFSTNLLSKNLIFLLITLGLFLRIVYLIILPDNEIRIPQDSFYYDQIAKNILNCEGYHEGHLLAYRPPLYSYFLSFMYILFGEFPKSYYIVGLMQCLLSMISVFYFYKLCNLLFTNNKIVITTTALYCFYPTFIVYPASLLSETLFFSIFIPGFYYTYKGLTNYSLINCSIGAFLLGISCLVRELPFYFVPVILCFCFFLNHESRLKRIIISSCIIFSFGIAIAPWIIRNYFIFEVPLITTNGGINFYMGNNSSATAFFNWKLPSDIVWINDLDPTNISSEEFREIELNTHKKCFTEGIKFIQTNPEMFTILTLKRALFFWLPPRSDFHNIKLELISILKLFRSLYAMIISTLSIIGIVIAFRKKLYPFGLILAWIFFTTLFHSVIYVDHRYSLSMVPFLCIFAVLPLIYKRLPTDVKVL